jgi:hypothetical protein
VTPVTCDGESGWGDVSSTAEHPLFRLVGVRTAARATLAFAKLTLAFARPPAAFLYRQGDAEQTAQVSQLFDDVVQFLAVAASRLAVSKPPVPILFPSNQRCEPLLARSLYIGVGLVHNQAFLAANSA